MKIIWRDFSAVKKKVKKKKKKKKGVVWGDEQVIESYCLSFVEPRNTVIKGGNLSFG